MEGRLGHEAERQVVGGGGGGGGYCGRTGVAGGLGDEGVGDAGWGWDNGK